MNELTSSNLELKIINAAHRPSSCRCSVSSRFILYLKTPKRIPFFFRNNWSFDYNTQLGVFIYYAVEMGGVGPNGPVPFKSPLIYDPFRRYEAWRFLSYMLIHSG